MKYNTNSQTGFSLVETLVAISILLIVIVGPLTISTSAARSTSFASEQVVAFFLAQEGVELAQMARDDLLLANFGTQINRQFGWDRFAGTNGVTSQYATCFGASGCGLELNTNDVSSLRAPVTCTGNSCNLYYSNVSNNRARYTHISTGNQLTLFSRVINFYLEGTAGVRVDGVRVESKVTWRSGNQRDTQEVVVDTYLYNVYGN